MGKTLIETVMGAVVLLVAVGFMVFAYQSSNLKPVTGYSIKAKFDTVSGLSNGADVRIGGIKVGVVSAMELDTKTYQAVVTLQVKEGVQLPKDSTASVIGDGLLGAKFVALEPGGDEENLANGGEIAITQSSVNLETLIGKVMFSGGGVDKKNEKAPNAQENGASPNSVPSLTN